MTDEELMLAYRAGDALAFETLYRRHSSRIHSFLRSRVHRAEDADDLFQRVFAKLHQSRASYDPGRPFLPWLFVITRTAHLDWAREKRPGAYHPHSVETDLDSLPSSQADPEKQLADSEPGPLLAALSKSAPEDRALVAARVLDDETYEALAARLGTAEATIRQRVSRALRRLRANLHRQGTRQEEAG